MHKKIILVNKKYSGKFHVIIYKGKLIEYFGLSNSRFFDESNSEPETFKINTEYKILKLNKYDQKEHKIKASHILKNEQLDFITGGMGMYLDLNQFEILKIRWSKKEYIIQSKEIKTDIIKYLIGAILGFIGTTLFQKISLYNAEPNNPPKQEIKKSLDHTKKVITDTIVKLDSLKSNLKVDTLEKNNVLKKLSKYPSSKKVEFTVSASKKYSFSKPIEITLVWTNKSKSSEKIMLREYWSHPIGIVATITDLKTKQSLQEYPSTHALSSQLFLGKELEDYEITLNPNETKVYKVDLLQIPYFKNRELDRSKKIPKGKYSAQVSYYESISNSFEFEIE